MTKFEPRCSGAGSNRSINCATTTSHIPKLLSFLNGPTPASFCLFSYASHSNKKYSSNFNNISIDGMLRIRTRGHSMVGADDTMDLKAAYLLLSYFYEFLHHWIPVS